MSLFIDSAVSDTELQNASRMLKHLGDLRTNGCVAIGAEAVAYDTIMRDFFLFHLEEVPDALPESVRLLATNEAFVGALKLCGVAIHKNDEFAFELVLDFSFGKEHSDQVLAVKFGPDGVIRDVCHES